MISLVTGGASSGKTRYACSAADAHGGRVLYVATCVARDPGMRRKIERHRAERPPSFTTLEQDLEIADAITHACATDAFEAVIVDCLTLLISQMLVAGCTDSEVLEEIDALAATPVATPVYVVTNEVGCGIVPLGELSRRFVELQGRANARIAAASDTVVWMVSGIPVQIKPPHPARPHAGPRPGISGRARSSTGRSDGQRPGRA